MAFSLTERLHSLAIFQCILHALKSIQKDIVIKVLRKNFILRLKFWFTLHPLKSEKFRIVNLRA